VTARLVLRGGVLADATLADVAIDPATGTIVAVGADVASLDGDVVERCDGMVILPAPAEPHAHLDKALSAEKVPNPVGDLAGAILAWHAFWPKLTHDDLVSRATAAVEGLVLHGTTAIRTHVDVGQVLGLKSIRALLDVKADIERRGLAELQLVALVSIPLSGPDGADHRRLLDEALDLGVDVAGGCPHLDPDPQAATALALDAARRHGVPLDLHTDETLDPDVLWVRHLARLISETGFSLGATASHCVSLGMQPVALQEKVAAELADVDLAVVTLPQTNLFLQARAQATAPPRGLTAVRALLSAGVTLAAGADNVRDPFCHAGRLDALETAALLIMAGHLTPEEAWTCCSASARRAMGLATGTVAAGQPAELLGVEGASLGDAIAGAGERRVTIHQGRVVARTRVTRTLLPVGSAVEA
jgi:cytosine deaminase